MNCWVGTYRPRDRRARECPHKTAATLAEALEKCDDTSDIYLPAGGEEYISRPLVVDHPYVQIMCETSPNPPRWFWPRIIWWLRRKHGYKIAQDADCYPLWGDEQPALMELRSDGATLENLHFDVTCFEGTAIQVGDENLAVNGLRIIGCRFVDRTPPSMPIPWKEVEKPGPKGG